jgi:Prohead core protein serine protease
MFCHGDKVTKNNRIYPESVLDEAVQEFQRKIKTGNAFGTLGHDASSMSVDPTKISHVVQSLAKQGKSYYGRAKIIDAGAGKILSSIINAKGALGISHKAAGSTRKRPDGISEALSPVSIISFDAVCDPSQSENYFRTMQEELECLIESAPRGHTLDVIDLLAAAFGTPAEADPMMILKKHGLDRYPEIVAAQLKHAKHFDKTYGLYQDPHGKTTYLDNLEAQRAELVQKLLDLQAKIASQNDSGIVDDKARIKDKMAAYAKLISQTSNPIKKNSLRVEAAHEMYTSKVISEATNLLSRIGKSHGMSPKPEELLIKHLREQSASNISHGENEVDAVLTHHRKNPQR